MQQAAFSLETYKFNKVEIDLDNTTSKNLNIIFLPEGLYREKDGIFELKFTFISHTGNIESPMIVISCIASFKFEDTPTLEDIPNFFYANSIAIIFPYMRSFVSTVTLQANIPLILLPTYNLTSLGQELRNKTTQI